MLLEFEDLPAIKISNIKLANLQQKDVNTLINDSLLNTNSQNSENIEKLSKLIYTKTFGNAFFTVQFLQNLYEEGFLKFNFKINSWEWNFNLIKNQNITDNVIELMANKVTKLPIETQNILRIAACIGNRFDLKILSSVSKYHYNVCEEYLETAIIENLISPLNKQDYKFAHGRIKQAVYSTIPDNDKNSFHLQTGRLLLKLSSAEDVKSQLFNIVSQLNYGINLINTEEEKHTLAKLNLDACHKSKLASAYMPAYNYAKVSLSLLKDNSWEKDYDFTLKIYNHGY